jgi:CobQ-like glutamine amidotransferase family enzyme
MLSVCHLYPDLLNSYGNRGNIVAFTKRCQWRNISVRLLEVNLGLNIDFSEIDFLFIGSGGEREQELLMEALLPQRDMLLQAIEQGLVILAIGSGFQILGHSYPTSTGETVPGLGLLNFDTKAGDQRLTGDVAIELKLASNSIKITGFENHVGRTYLGNIEPLGEVLSGHGNNGQDGYEGARYKNVFCSYLYGPILPKNSMLTDHLIELALNKRGLEMELAPLDDTLEEQANRVLLKRLLNS